MLAAPSWSCFMPSTFRTSGAPADGPTKWMTTQKENFWRSSRESKGVRVQHIAHGGPPGAVICWVAQKQQCDQIVMGTHGRTGLMHLVLGSVADYVIRHARCPVLTVRQREANEQPLKEPVGLPADAADHMMAHVLILRDH